MPWRIVLWSAGDCANASSCWSSRLIKKSCCWRYVTIPAIAMPNAVNAMMPISSRARTVTRESTFGRRPERVANAADGVDQRRAELVDLLAEIADVRLDDVRVALEVVLPNMIENLRLRQGP